ncbi:MAG: hypothetical protein K5884_04840 [Ruminococcus sp.]|uniref:hypothetical protein n=1 Tax=uncultured Ruminococcus sp. TaxID=165186 RepID=UPI002615F1EB|nr:hypothetical protein [uncultured Ruminococcus sp.]MCR4861927.1 hypothetical protein [Ruminococcus sp.]
MVNRYKMADKVIKVSSLYEAVHEYCKDYATDEQPDFSVNITPDDIVLEKQKSGSEYAYEVMQ